MSLEQISRLFADLYGDELNSETVETTLGTGVRTGCVAGGDRVGAVEAGENGAFRRDRAADWGETGMAARCL